MSLLTFVAHYVVSVINAFWHRLIAHVYGITSFLCEVRLPNGNCFVFLFRSANHAGSTHGERILAIAQNAIAEAEATFACICPRFFFGMLSIP